MLLIATGSVIGATVIDRLPRRPLVLGSGAVCTALLAGFVMFPLFGGGLPAAKYIACAFLCGYFFCYG